MKGLAADKKILITGGCGYVGSRCALDLNQKGYQVIVADKVRPKERGITLPSTIEFRHGDLRDPKKASLAVAGVDTILHLAANIGSLTYMHDHQAEIVQENSAIDAALYPAAVRKGVSRIIYSSSSMVFQHAPRFPYKESDILKINPPTNIYGMSKLLGEYFCRAYHEQLGLPYVIIRYHNIYGPGEEPKGESLNDLHVIPALIERVFKGQYPLEVLGNPEATRSFTYIDDAVKATVMILERAIKDDPKVINNDFNIDYGDSIKIVDLAKLIWKLLGDNRPFRYAVKTTKAVTTLRREASPQKIKEIIGWEPETKLEQGILKTAEWIKTRGSRP